MVEVAYGRCNLDQSVAVPKIRDTIACRTSARFFRIYGRKSRLLARKTQRQLREPSSQVTRPGMRDPRCWEQILIWRHKSVNVSISKNCADSITCGLVVLPQIVHFVYEESNCHKSKTDLRFCCQQPGISREKRQKSSDI